MNKIISFYFLCFLLTGCSTYRCTKFEKFDAGNSKEAIPFSQTNIQSDFSKFDKTPDKKFVPSADSCQIQYKQTFNGIQSNFNISKHIQNSSPLSYSNFKFNTARKALRLYKKVNAVAAEEGGGALKTIGWIILIVGLLILIFASIIFGALLMLLGLVFVLSGGKSKDETQKSEELDDVIYLKNGNILRGTIIEQIPNESVKIKTKDGNVFGYKIDEVLKITKEAKQ